MKLSDIISEELKKKRLDAEAGGGSGGSGAGGSAGAGGSVGGTGGDAGGDAGGDTGSDTGGTDASDVGSTEAPVSRGFYSIGTMAPYRSKKKKKKKKKKSGVNFGGSIYETLEAAQDMNALLQGIEADLEQREKDLKKLPKKSIYGENFADGKKKGKSKPGKVKGKSRPGRVKKAGASCKGSVSSLRAKAKKYSGEKGKMYHWCANMKAGKRK